nr:glycoside hydrolase family 9 protein [Sphingomonas jejuensis]
MHVNQLGYIADAPKRAFVQSDATAPVGWSVVDDAGRPVLTGQSVPLAPDAAAGVPLHRIDLDPLAIEGADYRLVVGEERSAPFAVGPARLYAPLARDALGFFYQNRAGTPIEATFAGGAEWARPAGHLPERATCFSGTDDRGNRWPGCAYTLDVTGGWYDAGDHGKYVVNGGISLWTLLNLHEWSEAGGRALPVADGALPLPEAGNGVSDLLDHARWQMEFMLAMQVPADTRLSLPVDQAPGTAPLRFSTVEAGGMAHHKVADVAWTALPMRPDRDPQPRFLYPPSTAATLNLAATAAQCARVWRDLDPTFAARCRAAAVAAWNAAERNPRILAHDFAGSGSYGDGDLSDERFWAAAELFATTGDARFAAVVRQSPFWRQPIAAEPGWASVAPLGLISIAVAGPDSDAATARTMLVDAARRWAAEAPTSAVGIPYAGTRYQWGSNSNLLNRAMILAMAAGWTGDQALERPAIAVMDYLLGANPLGMSYVTGYGVRRMENPHHRFWARQLDASYPPPPPGVLSGGPNNQAMSDDVAKELRGRCAAQQCWRDDARAFSMNEVAINWNAPLAWMAAWMAGDRP